MTMGSTPSPPTGDWPLLVRLCHSRLAVPESMSAVVMDTCINCGTVVFFCATKPSRTTRLAMFVSSGVVFLSGLSLEIRYLPSV